MNAHAVTDASTLDELAEYAVKTLAQVKLAPVRMAVDVFRLGHALSIARTKMKKRKDWVSWQAEHKLPRPTVNQAIRLYGHFKTEDTLDGMSIMVAKREAGIIKPQAKPKPPTLVAVDSPKVVIRFERTIHSVEKTLRDMKAEADIQDLPREHVATLARELTRLAKEATELAKSKAKTAVLA